jgi:hypothetical protein
VDIKTAFLYGNCVQDIYVQLPQPLQTKEEKEQSLVRKMLKSLYGTPDAPKIWYKTFAEYLGNMGFEKCGREPCLFKNLQSSVLIMLYVDDLAIAGPRATLVTTVLEQLKQKFQVRELGIPTMFLGINIEHFPERQVIFINQKTYINKLVEKYQLENQFPRATPASATEQLQPLEEGECITAHPYRSLVGELLYISVCTRPDIAFAVGILSKFLDRATDTHWNAAIRVLLYLKGTMTYGLPLGGKGNSTNDLSNSTNDLTAYVDADFANDTADYKSITGYMIFFNGSVISWSSKKQKSVTLSSTESEFIALTDVAKELLWIQPIYRFLGIQSITECTIILEDNLPVINLALNQQTKGRTKHLNVKVKFIAQLIEEKIFKIQKVKSANNCADQLTKAQGKTLFIKQRNIYMADRPTLLDKG